MNITVEVPVGTTNHGQPDIYCVPATWKHYIDFSRQIISSTS